MGVPHRFVSNPSARDQPGGNPIKRGGALLPETTHSLLPASDRLSLSRDKRACIGQGCDRTLEKARLRGPSPDFCSVSIIAHGNGRWGKHWKTCEAR